MPGPRPFACRILAMTAALLCGVASGPQESAPPREGFAELEARLAEEFKAYDDTDWQVRQRVAEKMAAQGPVILPVLTDWIQQRSPRWEGAVACLSALGEEARPALPAVWELLHGTAPRPIGRASNDYWRVHLLVTLTSWTWAASEFAPLFLELACREDEATDLRTRALYAFSSWKDEVPQDFVDRSLLPALQPLLDDPDCPDAVQAEAIGILVRRGAHDEVLDRTKSSDDDVRWEAHRAAQKAGDVPQQEYFRALLDRDPSDPNAHLYLWLVKEISHTGIPDPWVRGLKSRLRRSLAATPDARTAMALASIIQFELRGAQLSSAWATEGYPDVDQSPSVPRADPDENYSTLAAALEIAFQASEAGSETWHEAGTALAKIALLQGRWGAMNRALRRLGQAPIDPELRPRLHAPPKDWSQLSVTWGEAGPAVRSGDCGVLLSFEKDGRGLPGVQVLLKPRAKTSVFYTGIQTDTLLLAPEPMNGFFDMSFGYAANDLVNTRYAVSDEQGRVLFEGLPNTRMVMEVLVPSGLFEENCSQYELWTDGPLRKPAGPGGGPDEIGFRLEDNTLHSCSPLVVRSVQHFTVDSGTAVDPRDFVLEWDVPQDDAVDHAELRLRLVQPTTASWSWLDPIEEQTVVVRGNHWSLGEKGVGKLRLVPGNTYTVELWTKDQNARAVHHIGRTMLWVPWTHRECRSPFHVDDPAPWQDVGGIQLSGVADDDLDGGRTMIRKWIADHPQAFVLESLLLIQAWYEWRAGQPEEAREILGGLLDVVDARCHVAVIADQLLQGLNAGEAPPVRLSL